MTAVLAAPRVAMYLRVSTGRQADGDLSIPDQERQIRAYCDHHGWTPVATFTDAGLSATDDRRPEFQRMIEAATRRNRPFDVIAVHSMSRFFRDLIQGEFTILKLRKVGVRVVSITQTFQDDAMGEMARRILGTFDEYQSRENAKHTLRSMRENARQGYWNGSAAPFGYATERAGQRGARVKKRLVIHDDEASVVRRIFDLALGRQGPALGIKAIVSRLNADGYRRRGKPFQISSVHRILTSSTYAGSHVFNRRRARDGERKPREEWETATVSAIVTTAEFEAVQAHLSSRQPQKVPPRVVGSPTLLTGLARCGFCASGMTLRTGKGGRYRYYACAGRAQKGATCCPGRSITMAALDGMVLEHLADRLFTPDRLREVLVAYLADDAAHEAERRSTLARLRQRRTEAAGGIERLLDLVAKGVMTADDPTLRDKVDALRSQQAVIDAEIGLLETSAKAPVRAITPQRIERFAAILRDVLGKGDAAFRKAYLRLFVERIDVMDDRIHITGQTATLAHAVAAQGEQSASKVPSFVPEWRPVGNPRPTFAGDMNSIISMT